VSDQLSREQVVAQRDSLYEKDKEIRKLKDELYETNKKLENVILSRKSEGTALLELEHFKTDQERMIQLLASTKEFSNFGKFAADSGKSVKFVSDGKSETVCHYPKPKSKLKTLKESEEVEDWIPEETFKVAHEFRSKFGN